MGRNDITGDKLQSKVGNTEAFSTNYDAIFGKKDKELAQCKTAEHRKCDCPTWTLGCCGTEASESK